MPEKGIRIETEIPLKDYKAIERLVEDGRYKSIHDFIAIAIRRLLAEELVIIDLDKKTFKAIKEALGIK